MATNLDRLRNVQVSAGTAEASYDAAAAVDCRILVNAGVVPDDAVEVVNDLDLIGGTEEASSSELIAQSVSFPMAQNRVKPHTLAFMASYALGSVATTTPAGGTTARKHTITPILTSADMASFTTEGLLKTGLQKSWAGCMMDSFDFSFQRGANRFANISGSALGSGTVTDGTATQTEVSEGGLNAATAAVWLDATTFDGSMSEDLDLTTNDLTSNPTALGNTVIGMEWNYRNNIDADFLYTIGSGDQFGVAERVARDQTLTLTILWQDETYRDYLIADTDMALQFKIKNAQIGAEGLYYGCQGVFPKLRIASRPKSEQGGRLIETITFNVLQDATHGSVILDVFNIQTGYMA